MVKDIFDSNFKEEVLECDKPVVVEFFATWCPHCKALAPVLEKVSEETEGVKFVRMDIDQNIESVRRFNIESTPTLIIFENGEIVDANIGFLPRRQLVDFIQANI